jgi:hypothetical protein
MFSFGSKSFMFPSLLQRHRYYNTRQSYVIKRDISIREEQILKAFGNLGLERIFGPERRIRRTTILHNDDLHNLHSSPNIIRLINSRRILWSYNLAIMGEIRNACNISLSL